MASTHLRDATDHGITFGLPNRDIHLAPRPRKKSLKHSAVLLIYEHMEVAESFPQQSPTPPKVSVRLQHHSNAFPTFRHNSPQLAVARLLFFEASQLFQLRLQLPTVIRLDLLSLAHRHRPWKGYRWEPVGTGGLWFLVIALSL